MNNVKKLIISAVFIAASCIAAAAAQDFDVISTVDWKQMKMTAEVSMDMAQAGLTLPGGRVRGEELLRLAGPALLESRLLDLTVNSSGRLRDLIDSGEISYDDTTAIIAGAKISPPVMSDDLSRLRIGYEIPLGEISAALVRHSRAGEIRRNLDSGSASAYTGIIIIAAAELPVHGMKRSAFTLPCLFPKIHDSRMNLLYERNMLDPELARKQPMVRYAAENDIFLPTPSGLSDDLIQIVGERPLRILAGGVFGEIPTDPVIDAADARLISSSESTRALLRQGKVVIVLSDKALRTSDAD